MKYIAIDQSNHLYIAEQDKPNIESNECLVRVKGIGVNRADLLQREGKYPAPKGDSPILGLEISGDIVECGSCVHHFQQGDKIFALVSGGGYAEYVKVKADLLFYLPENMSYAQGAATAEVFLTAYQSLFSLSKLKNHDRVLIHAGASGVGTAAIQLAKARFCEVVVTVGTAEKAKACLALGADHAIIYKETDFVTWSKEHMPEGYDVIIDVVAGDYFNKNILVAGLDAHIVILSLLGGRYSHDLDIAKLLLKRITVTASTLRNRSDRYKANLVQDFYNDFYHQFAKEQLLPFIDSVYSWSGAEQAHDKLYQHSNIGKLVLMTDNDTLEW